MTLSREGDLTQRVLDLSSEFTALVHKGQLLAKEEGMPEPLRASLTEWVRYCDDTLADCDLSKAVDRWEDGGPQREAEAISYAREQAAEARRELNAHTLAAE